LLILLVINEKLPEVSTTVKLIISTKDGRGYVLHFVFASVCVSVCLSRQTDSAGYLKKLLTNFGEIFGRVGDVTGGDPDLYKR